MAKTAIKHYFWLILAKPFILKFVNPAAAASPAREITPRNTGIFYLFNHKTLNLLILFCDKMILLETTNNAILGASCYSEDSVLKIATKISLPDRFEDLLISQPLSTLDNNITDSCNNDPYQNTCLRRDYNLTIIPEKNSAMFYPSNNTTEPMIVVRSTRVNQPYRAYNTQLTRLPCTIFYSTTEEILLWQILQREAIFIPTGATAYLYTNKACRRQNLINFYIEEALKFDQQYHVSLTSGCRLPKPHSNQPIIYVAITTNSDIRADYLKKFFDSFLYCLQHNEAH